MDECFTRAVHNLFTACAQDDPTKINETVSVATIATECLIKERGSDWTFELLRTLIEKKTTEICSTSSLEGSPSPSPPTHPFWAIVKHLTPSTLHTLHTRTCKNLLSSLSQCYLPLFRTNPTYQLQGTLYKHMTQILSVFTNSCTTLEDLIRAMAAIYTLADCGSCLVMPQNDGEYEKLMKQVVARGPKVVYEAYNNCVQEELKSSSCLTSSRGVLKSVDVLTGSMFLMATVTKTTHSPGDTVIETALRLYNHCLEHLIHLVKLFPGHLPLSSLYLVFSSLVHLNTEYRQLCSVLDFEGHPYTEQLFVHMSDCHSNLTERVVCYHTQLCETCLLQDKDSNDWSSSQPFYDNERCSFSIQMWHYQLLNLQHDLWTHLHPTLSDCIVMEILGHTLSFLAGRYNLVSPSHKRVKQARADILSILLTTSQLLADHTPSPAVQKSCDSLVVTLGLTLSPLHTLSEHLNTGSLLSEEHHRTSQSVSGDWRSFLRISGFPSCTSIYGKGGSSQSKVSSDGATSKESKVLIHSYPQCDRARWPNLLQALCQDSDLSLRVGGCGGVETVMPHLVTVLAHCYHSPHTLSHTYDTVSTRPSGEKSDQGTDITATGEQNMFLQAITRLVVDGLQKSVLPGATRLYYESISKVGVLEGVLMELVEEVSLLPSPLLHFIRSLADSKGSPQQPLGRRVAKVIGDMLGEWLKSAIFWLSEPLTSIVSNYATLLTRSLSGSSRQQSPRTDGIFQRLEEIFSVMGVASGEVGVASITEHEMAVDVMSKDENVFKSLKIVCESCTASHSSHLPHRPHSHNPLDTHNTICGIPMATIMERTEDLKWNDLLAMFSTSRSKVGSLVARRWELQDDHSSLLTEDEAKQVLNIRTQLA